MPGLQELLKAYFLYFEVYFKAMILDKFYICMAKINAYILHPSFSPKKLFQLQISSF